MAERPLNWSVLASAERPFAILILVAGLCHLPALTGGLVWDDVEIVKRRPVVRSVSAAVAAFARYRPWQLHRVGTPRPRPLRDLTLAVDHAVWRGRPGGYHFTSWALHVAVVCLVFAALRALGVAPPFAFTAAVLFAVHPAGAESVAQIKNRGDLAAAAACLASLLCALRVRRALLAMALSFVLFLAALLCAEWPAAAPPAFMLALWLMGHGRRARLFAPHLLLGLAFAYWAGRSGPMSGLHVLAALRNAAGYVGLGAALVEPSPAPFVGAAALAACAAAVALLAVALGAASPRARRTILAGALWAAVVIVPFCFATARVSGRPIATHRLYFACIGIGLVVARAAGAAMPGRRRAASLAILIAVVWAASAMHHHFTWVAPRALWTAYAEQRPAAPTSYMELATVASGEGRLDAAAAALGRAEQLAQRDEGDWRRLGPDILGNLGYVRLQQGRIEEAIEILDEARDVRETSMVLNTLGMALERQGDHVKAAQAFRRALALDPTNAQAYHNLGNAFSQRGELEAAAKHYAAAIYYDPDLRFARLALGRVLYQMGRLDAARRFFEAAAQGETYAEAQRLLGLVAFEQERYGDAARCVQAALDADSNSWRAHMLAGYIAEAMGNRPAAIAAYERVLELNANVADARERIAALRSPKPAKPPSPATPGHGGPRP